MTTLAQYEQEGIKNAATTPKESKNHKDPN